MKSLQDYFTIYHKAAWEKDIEAITALYDDKVIIFDMWMQGYHEGLAEWSAVIKNWLGSLSEERVKVKFEKIKINEFGDVGFASALITYQAVSANNDIIRSMKNRITVGFRRGNDAWKVVHQHTSCPIDSMLKGILQF